MRIGVPKETEAGERRVALVPEVVAKLVRSTGEDGAAPVQVLVERGAGAGALIPDEAFADAGAELVDAAAALGADVVVKVAAPTDEQVAQLAADVVVVGFLGSVTNADGGGALGGAQ